MSNLSFNPTAVPVYRGSGSSAVIRNEFAAIGAGFAIIEAMLVARSTIAEWVDTGYTEVYSSPTVFVWNGVDATSIMKQYRRIRATVNGSYVYSEVVSSVFSGGNTTVTILDAVLTNQLTLVEHSFLTPYEEAATTLSTNQLNILIAAEVASQFSALATILNSLIPIEVDTTAGDVVKTLSTTAVHAKYVKESFDANVVTFDTSNGDTFFETVILDLPGSSVSFDKVGTVWYASR